MFKDRYLVLDYNKFSIQAILVEVSFGKSNILQKKYWQITEEHETYDDAMSFFLDNFFPDIQNIILILSSETLIIRDFVLPIKSRKTVLDVLPFEFENLTAQSADSIEVVANILNVDKEESFLNAFGIEHQVLEDYLSILLKKNLYIKALFIDSICLSSIVEKFYTKYFNEKEIIQIDVGEDATILNIVKDGKLVHTRFIDCNFFDVVSYIAKFLSASVEETASFLFDFNFNIFNIMTEIKSIEEFKKHYDVTNSQISHISVYLRNFFTKVITEVNRSLISLEIEPKEIYFSGILLKLKGSKEYLAASLKRDIYTYTFLDFDDFRMLMCLGAIYHFELTESEKIDYSKTAFVKQFNRSLFSFKQFVPHFVIFLISALILAFNLAAKIYSDRNNAAKARYVLEEKFKQGFQIEAKRNSSVIKQAKTMVSKEKEKYTIYNSTLNQTSILDVILELTRQFPSELDQSFVLDRFSFDENFVQIQARVNEFTEVGDIEKILQDSNMFENVEVQNKRLLRGEGRNKVSFRIKFEVK